VSQTLILLPTLYVAPSLAHTRLTPSNCDQLLAVNKVESARSLAFPADDANCNLHVRGFTPIAATVFLGAVEWVASSKRLS
jgi:hypothetical protein